MDNSEKPVPVSSLPLLLRRLEVCTLLAIKARTFDRMLATGKFPPADIVMNCKWIRWRRSTVEDWVHSGGRWESAA
jgi:predicted DNA-binding transcriptional regulator AlpA